MSLRPTHPLADELLHGPFLYQVVGSCAFASALLMHLSYFYNAMALLGILVLDQVCLTASWQEGVPTVPCSEC